MSKPKYIEIELLGPPIRGYPAFTLCFVMSPQGNCLLKGQNIREIEEYISARFSLCIYRMTFWNEGVSRGYWRGKCPAGVYIHISEPHPPETPGCASRTRQRKTHVQFHHLYTDTRTILKYRHMPNRWIPEWDKALERVR